MAVFLYQLLPEYGWLHLARFSYWTKKIAQKNVRDWKSCCKNEPRKMKVNVSQFRYGKIVGISYWSVTWIIRLNVFILFSTRWMVNRRCILTCVFIYLCVQRWRFFVIWMVMLWAFYGRTKPLKSAMTFSVFFLTESCAPIVFT